MKQIQDRDRDAEDSRELDAEDRLQERLHTQYNTEVLNYLIESYWLSGSRPTSTGSSLPNLDKEFAKYLKSDVSDEGGVANVMKESGQTKDDLHFTYRVSTIYAKLLKHYEKPITAAAIAAYYDAHKSSFGTPRAATFI